MTVVVVVDTSVWVSAFLNPTGYPARLVQAGKAGSIQVVSSAPLLEELQEVLLRPRIMKIRQATVNDVATFVASVTAVVRLAPVAGEIRLCRDPDDDVVLETAISGGATLVVSRDEDLTRDTDLTERLRDHGIETLTVQRLLDRLSDLPTLKP